MSDFRLRPACPADDLCLGVLATQVYLDTYARQGIRPAIARAVQAECAVPVFTAQLADPATSIVVAERDGHLVGFAQVRHDAPRPQWPGHAAAELRRLYVQEPSCGRGVGRALLREAERVAATRGAGRLWLTAWEGNARALAFYPRQGYEHVGMTVYSFEGEDFPNRLFARSLQGPAR